jgi:predicted transcriptional regulator of viral defense system
MVKASKTRFVAARNLFMKHDGVLRTSQAIEYGLHPRTLYEMREAGLLETLSRGLYRLSELPPVSDPDHVTVALKVPNAVFCLISALAYHDMTTQLPHEVYIALPRGAEPPRLQYPPVRLFWFTGKAFTEGVEKFKQDRVSLKVYSPEKTLADCFKYRNKIGMDTVLEALKFYQQRKKTRIDQLLHYARICRVEKIMRPYLEASL